MESNIYFIIGSLITLIISIFLLSLSTFELGSNQNDSISYQVSKIGANSLSIIILISLITLIYYTYNYRECPSTINQ